MGVLVSEAGDVGYGIKLWKIKTIPKKLLNSAHYGGYSTEQVELKIYKPQYHCTLEWRHHQIILRLEIPLV